MHKIIVVVAATMAATTLAGCGSNPSATSPPSESSEIAPTGSLGAPPWPAPSDVPPRVAAAGLDLGAMGMAEHYHPRLRIFIRGIEVPVAPNIGVDPTTGAMSAVHTHEGDGTIHIEAATKGEVFTLGQVFTQWGVPLSSTQIGSVRAYEGEQVSATSNGVPVEGDPQRLRMRPGQQIELRLG